MTLTTEKEPVDVVDVLAGIQAGGALDALRRRRPVTREQLQASHDALFRPIETAGVSVEERLLIAAFATRLTADDETAARYAALAQEADAARAAVVIAEAAAAAVPGPFGTYTELGLQAENTDGPRYVASTAVRDALGDRLTAALVHTQLLVSRPREASADALDALLTAGWSIDGIITLSQLVSFLAFQQRVAAGLRVLAAASDEPITTPEEPAA